MKILIDILQIIYHTIRRKTLCRLGYHKMTGKKTDRLALGELLTVPACSIFGCNAIDTKKAVLTAHADGYNGTLIDVPIGPGRPVIRGRALAACVPAMVESINETAVLLKQIKEDHAMDDHTRLMRH